VERLLAEGWGVTVVDNFDPFSSPAVKRANLARCQGQPNFRLVEADLRELGALRERLTGDYQIIAHLAASWFGSSLCVRFGEH